MFEYHADTLKKLTKSAIDDIDKTMTTRDTKEYSTKFIREVFPIHPIEGIRLGMKFKFDDQRKVKCGYTDHLCIIYFYL